MIRTLGADRLGPVVASACHPAPGFGLGQGSSWKHHHVSVAAVQIVDPIALDSDPSPYSYRLACNSPFELLIVVRTFIA